MNENKTLFISGTDTDAGKTLVACAILALANKQGLSTVAVKPIAAGCKSTVDGLRNDDALALIENSNTQLSYELVNPIALKEAMAPHIAAKRAGVTLSNNELKIACEKVIALNKDLTVIEGAGGWLVPLNESETLADLPKALNLPIILVVGIRLGCLNHALLSAQAIELSGLSIAGWVANIIEENPVSADNVDTLKHWIKAPCLGVIPRLDKASADNAAQYLDLTAVL